MNSDMTKYCYQHFENAYNIGWNVNFDSTVESKETFDSIFIEKLTLYCENPLNSDLNGVCHLQASIYLPQKICNTVFIILLRLNGMFTKREQAILFRRLIIACQKKNSLLSSFTFTTLSMMPLKNLS